MTVIVGMNNVKIMILTRKLISYLKQEETVNGQLCDRLQYISLRVPCKPQVYISFPDESSRRLPKHLEIVLV